MRQFSFLGKQRLAGGQPIFAGDDTVWHRSVLRRLRTKDERHWAIPTEGNIFLKNADCGYLAWAVRTSGLQRV